jgi:hypothetical protein
LFENTGAKASDMTAAQDAMKNACRAWIEI